LNTRSRLGDLYGGLTAAVVALPLGLAFGVAAFAPLGPDHIATGAIVGLLGCIITGFFAALLGGTPTQVTGPTGPMTVVVTAFVARIVAGHGADLPLVLASLAIMVATGGIVEILIGVVGGGRLVKVIPYPVVAGFMNGIAVIIFLGQIKPALGITGDYADFASVTAVPAIAVCAVTITAIIGAGRFAKALPASLVGLVAGFATYQLLAAFGISAESTVTNPLLIGEIPNPFHSLDDLRRIVPALHLGQLTALPAADLVNAALAGGVLGLLGAIDSLLTSIVADARTQTRHDSRRELIGQGIANIASGFGGGLPGAGATVRTLVNIGAGGRTRLSGMTHALVILAIVAIAGGLAAWIPLAALSGVLFVTAVGMVDKYSLRLVKRRKVRDEFAVMIAVTIITVAVDLITAVGVGCAIAGVLYVRQQVQQGVVHRRLRGDQVMSRSLRARAHQEAVRASGARTIIYELRGSLFFGTTDSFAQTVEADLAHADHFIFDLAHVRDIDLSGAQVLAALVGRIREAGSDVSLSGLRDLEHRTPFSVHAMLRDLDILSLVGGNHVFSSLDRALEACEERRLGGPTHDAVPLSLRDFDAFAELDDTELESFADHLEARSIPRGTVLFHVNDPVGALVLVRKGKLELIRVIDGHEHRLTALMPGAIVGTRALLRQQDARIAGRVRAATDAEVFLLAREFLDDGNAANPQALVHLQRGLLHSAVEQIDLLMFEVLQLER
jgi:SulP family sulfate permease